VDRVLKDEVMLQGRRSARAANKGNGCDRRVVSDWRDRVLAETGDSVL